MSHRIAIVDMGTNTLKFSVTEVDEIGTQTVIHASAETVRLGAGIQASGRIDPERATRALLALKAYELVAQSLGATVFLGVATAALRMASNGADLLDRISNSTEWEISIISGDEEARLTFAGLAGHFPAAGDVLLADIGGGSTEIISVRDRWLIDAESIQIGSGTLADRYFRYDPAGVSAVRDALEFARDTLGQTGAVREAGHPALFLSGGNGQFLHGLAMWDQIAVPFTPAGFERLVDAISTMKADAMAQHLGIAEERAAMLPAGAAIAMALIELSGAASIQAVPSGIRGGLVQEWIGNQKI